MTSHQRLICSEYTIAGFGLAIAGHALFTGSLPVWHTTLFFAIAGIGFLQMQVTLPSGIQISPSLPLIMAALLLHGLPLATLLLVPGGVLRVLTIRRPLSTALFSAGQLIICAQVALLAHGATRTYSLIPGSDVLAIVAATFSFDLINLALVAGRASLARQTSAWSLFTRTLIRERSALIIPYHLLTVLTCLLYMDRGFLGLMAGLLCVLALRLLMVFQHDLTQNSQQARVDHLTGTYNPRFLNEWFQIQAPAITAQNEPCTVLFADMDDLKEINDLHGHHVGDRAIRQLADLLRSCIRSSDILFRYGGDEFVIICPNVDAKQAAAVAARVLRGAQEQALFDQDQRIGLSLSIGTASFPQQYPHLDMGLIQLADRAMYLAKSQGRNRVCSASQLIENPRGKA